MREIRKEDSLNEAMYIIKSKSTHRYSRKSTRLLMEHDLVIVNGVPYEMLSKSVGAGVYSVWGQKKDCKEFS